jgi:hypothetical protein
MRGSRRCFDRCHRCGAVAVGPATPSDDERYRDHIALHKSGVIAGSSPGVRSAHADVRRRIDRVLLTGGGDQSDSFSTWPSSLTA